MIQPGDILVHHFLEKSAELYPDKTALVHEELRASYAFINKQANQLAHWLVGLGVRQGDRVAMILENSYEYVVGYYGSLKTGAVMVPLSTGLKPDGLKAILHELEPKAVISSFRFERLLKATHPLGNSIQALLLKEPKQQWPAGHIPIYQWEAIFKADDSVHNPSLPIEASFPASIIYTSGSTGVPKGAVLSHQNITSNTRSICSYLRLFEKDIQMVVLPFFYVMGQSLLNTHFAVGGSVVINNKFAFPATVIQQMIAEKVTGFSGVPSTYAYLLNRSPLKNSRHKLTSLRYCSQAGGHMSRQLKQELRDVLPGHTKIYIMYGATEASARLTGLPDRHFLEKIDSIGKPITGVTINILNKDGEPAGPNETGEIVASGANIMQGYWKDQSATSRVLDTHGYHTGDLGYIDEDGYIYVTGRKDNMLKVGGHRVNAQEVEDALMETDLLIEVSVVGIPDKMLGHKLIALAVPKSDGFAPDELLRLCAEKLPRYKIPDSIVMARALPKNESGKIDRLKCLDMVRA